MNIGLFIPCYVNQFYPQVGIATLELLEKFGCRVNFPLQQTCCGQPMANSGYEHLTKHINQLFVKYFSGFDYIVCPSGSCVLHLKEHIHAENEKKAINIRNNIFELVEFLTDIVKIKQLDAKFPFKVSIHQSCHGQRGLKLAQMSELVARPYSKLEKVLNMVAGLQLVQITRKDECCGFGGTFCVVEEAVSVKMGKDRLEDHQVNGAEFITGADMSCLMHLEGILKRDGRNIGVKHIAEILNSKGS